MLQWLPNILGLSILGVGFYLLNVHYNAKRSSLSQEERDNEDAKERLENQIW